MSDTTGVGTSRSREFLFKSLVMLIGLIIGLAVVELALRILTPKEVMRYFFMSPDSVLHHRFTPSASGRYQTTEFDTEYRINSLGMREREIPPEKPANAIRVLMLGDSFTEGDGVEMHETFAKVLERHLDSVLPSVHCEVLNAGVGSYSPILEFLYLKSHGLSLEPDLVILNLDLSDFYDDLQYGQSARFDDQGVPLAVQAAEEPSSSSPLIGLLTGVKDFFKENTRTYNFVRIRIDRYLEGIRHEGVFSGDIRFDKYAMLRENRTVIDSIEFSRTYDYLILIRDLLKDRGVDFLLTVYPYGHQVSEKEWGNGRQFWGFKADTLYSCGPQSLIERWGLRNGMKVVNMCGAFRKASAMTYPLYLDYNGHWTPAGHRVVAGALSPEVERYLRAKGFLPVTGNAIH